MLIYSHIFTIVGSTANHSFLIYSDDFEDFNIENWIIKSTDPIDEGKWNIVLHEGNNVLSLQGNMDAQLEEIILENYTIEVKTKFVNYNEPGHVSFRITDPSPRYFIRFDSKDLRLVKNLDMLTELKIVECKLDPDRWYKFKISCTGQQISVYIDDELLIEYLDEDPLSLGGVGLETGVSSHLYFDDIMVFSTHDVYVTFLLNRVENEINKGRAKGYDTTKAEEKLDQAYDAFDKEEYSLSETYANDAIEAVYIDKIDEEQDQDIDDSRLSINWSIQTITGLITIGAAVVGTGSWFIRRRSAERKGRILISKRLEEVDDIYSRFKMNSIKCEAELIRLKGEILHEFKEGLIDEENFETLDKRIDKYLKEIREEIKKDKNI
jgi:hypothetical protein